MVEFVSITALVVGLLKDIGILDQVKDKLKKRSGDPAFNQISEVLTKMFNFYSTMDKELSILTKLSVADEQAITQTKDVLRNYVKGGALLDNLRVGRLKSGEIKSIWEEGVPENNIPSLENWVGSLKKNNTIDGGEYTKIRSLFINLSKADSILVQIVNDINDYANKKADKILPLINSNDIPGAGIETEKMKLDIENFRNQLSDSSGQLQRLGAEFTNIKGQHVPKKRSFRQKLSSVFSGSKPS